MADLATILLKLSDALEKAPKNPPTPTERTQQILGGASRFATAGGSALSGDSSPFSAAGSTLSGAGQIAGMMGPWGKAAQVGLEFTAAIVQSVDKLKQWARGLHDANMQFAEFSGAMARVQVGQQVRDMRLSREKGDARAAGAERLAQSMSVLERQTAPLENAWANFKNEFGVKIIEVAVAILAILQKLEPLTKLMPGEAGANAKGEKDKVDWTLDILTGGFWDKLQGATRTGRFAPKPDRMK